MERLQTVCENLARHSVQAGGLMLLVSAVFVTFEVVARKLFGFSLAAVDELSGYVFGIATTWALSLALFRRSHIRVDALYVKLPTRLRGILDVLALASLAVVFSLLAFQAVQVFLETLRLGAEANTPLRTPLWIPQVFWVTGLCFFVFNIYLLLIRTSIALLRGDHRLVHALAAAPSVREEAGAGVEQARRATARARTIEREQAPC
jgi:TRAP-type C4-dicarboxylate transport system permease small subunit